jgi:hypothetical protein
MLNGFFDLAKASRALCKMLSMKSGDRLGRLRASLISVADRAV